MKIVQILPELNAGGVERGTLEIAASLVSNNHQAIVISAGGRMVDELVMSGARHLTMPVHLKHPATLLQVIALRRFLAEESPDILHIRSRVPGWVSWLAWRSMDRATRPRLVSTVHGFYSVNAYSAIMTRGERVIAVSECIRSHVMEHYPTTPADNIKVILRGIDPARYNANQSPSPEWLANWQALHPEIVGKVVLLLPGRITRLKGHEDFFHLISALKLRGISVHGLVAGDTHPKKRDYRNELDGLVRSLGLADDITFLGHRTDLREIMMISNVVCALSQQPESFGRTVLEALALGKPVVGYDCGGVGELLEKLFPEGQVPLGSASSLLETTSSMILSGICPRAVGDPFTLAAMCRDTLNLYRDLVDSPR